MCGFTSSCTCEKSNPAIRSLLKNCIVSNDSVYHRNRNIWRCYMVVERIKRTYKHAIKIQNTPHIRIWKVPVDKRGVHGKSLKKLIIYFSLKKCQLWEVKKWMSEQKRRYAPMAKKKPNQWSVSESETITMIHACRMTVFHKVKSTGEISHQTWPRSHSLRRFSKAATRCVLRLNI